MFSFRDRQRIEQMSGIGVDEGFSARAAAAFGQARNTHKALFSAGAGGSGGGGSGSAGSSGAVLLKQRKEAALLDVVRFCESDQCRRSHLLEYFGEKNHARTCGEGSSSSSSSSSSSNDNSTSDGYAAAAASGHNASCDNCARG